MAKGEVDAQQELKDAFETRDLVGFKRAITRGAQPNLSSKRDEDNQMSIFEKALSTSGCPRFIKACFDAGCDPNYVNPKLKKAAIHYVIDSGIGSASHYNASNLYVLVDQPNYKVDVDHMYEGETALSRLIKSLEVKNPPGRLIAIRLLLGKGASTNIDDKSLMQQVLLNENIPQENRTELISAFVQAPQLSRSDYFKGVDFLLKSGYLNGDSDQLYVSLLPALLGQPASPMLDTLAQYQKTIVNWDNKKMLRALLMEHITNHTENALEAVLATLEKNLPEENEYIVEVAVKYDSWSTVLQLLKSVYLKLVRKGTLLKTMIRQVQLKPLDNYLQRNEYQECLLRCVKDWRQYINDFDNEHKTPLHYAVLCRNEIAIRVLLREDARLGVRNDKNRLLIEDIDAKLLEEHFDYCITGRGEKTSHDGYEIIMNCLNMTNENNELDIAPIACMARSKELCPLLEHPLITCFLQLKWSRLTTIFFTHFVINIILSLILGIHIWLRFPKRHNNEIPMWIVKSLFQVLIGYLLIVEVISLVIVKHWWRILIDFILIFMLILTNIECEDDIQRIITAFAIMLMCTKLIDLISALPVLAISTHMLMLRQVASTFAKSLLQYSMLLFSFSLCFYVLFSKPNSTDSTNSTDSANSTDNDFSLSFAKLDLSLMKTIFMFNGEYDNIDANGYFSSFVVIIFIFMVMVLSNLLGGLAVGDTQTIRAQVELNAAICRTNLLYSYEGLLDGNSPRCERLLRFFKKLMRIQAESTYGYVSIFPNQDNRVKVYSQRHRSQSIDCIELENEEDNVLLSQVFNDHEDSASDSESKMDKTDDLNLHFNKQVDAKEGTFSKPCVSNKRHSYDNITIEIQTVAQALKIIKERETKYFNEQRQEDIRMLLIEIKNRLDSMNPAK
ncbi:transient receptor potential cation channel protein painless-like isoform X1 [Drosophila sulfurigaster albostrigata]|uniref:transient receptor potential cation channel protein painless-like isoform X1 n=1 Tax=Drosophila sulfurigaster albostrigata TaxID=89887 RepID=UPI002D21BD95|nr:transient receptor potential cation channel protein painless-like isoform X1 [Drosophila sulfurigaster albostrigata]